MTWRGGRWERLLDYVGEPPVWGALVVWGLILWGLVKFLAWWG